MKQQVFWQPGESVDRGEIVIVVEKPGSEDLKSIVDWLKDRLPKDDFGDGWSFFPNYNGDIFFVFKDPSYKDLAMLFKLTWGGR